VTGPERRNSQKYAGDSSNSSTKVCDIATRQTDLKTGTFGFGASFGLLSQVCGDNKERFDMDGVSLH
jgi:hypothetical protein